MPVGLIELLVGDILPEIRAINTGVGELINVKVGLDGVGDGDVNDGVCGEGDNDPVTTTAVVVGLILLADAVGALVKLGI